jgi:uncharacterized protein
MQYRKFGKCNFDVSALGFGCMRLPIEGSDYNNINEAEAVKLIRSSIDMGVNYIDTAYPYHGGNSEILVGKALKDGYREKVKLATKMPVWLVKEYSDFDKYLNEQLEKLQTDHIDMYLMHALSKDRIDAIEKLNVYKFLGEAIKDGRIKYAGFSFHDDINTFKRIVDSFDWTFCQIQYNYLDIDYQAGLEGLKYAAKKGMAVVVMEPLKGGKLAVNLPLNVKNVFEAYKEKRTSVEWALKWIWNQPEVSLLLSGMNSMEQLNENIAVAENALPGSMDEEELKIVENARSEFKKLIKVDCTACEYCLPCPAGVNIPRNFSLYNSIYMHSDLEGSRKWYLGMNEKERASSCVECGKCEKLCPQHIEIRKQLKNAHGALK